MKTSESFKFKKGQTSHLDEIYEIQGIGGGEWWDHQNHNCGIPSDEIKILKNIEITIICDIK